MTSQAGESPPVFMKWLAVLFIVFIIVVIVLANNGELGSLHFIYDFPNGDKVGHFILFGILTFLFDLTFFQALPHADRKRIAIIIGLILAVLIGLEEFSQNFFHPALLALRIWLPVMLG